MPGTTNLSFEDSELGVLDAGHQRDESRKSKESNDATKNVDCLTKMYRSVENFYIKHQKICRLGSLVLLNIIILIYFIFATLYWRDYEYQNGCDWCHGYGLLVLIMVFGYGGILYFLFLKRYAKNILRACNQCLNDPSKCFLRRTKYGSTICKTVVYGCIFIAIIVFLIFDTVDSRERLMSMIGVVLLLSFGWLFSKHPGHVNWRPVLCGLILQFVFGLLTIRWPVGRAIFECISKKVATFLNFAQSGGRFIFSDFLVDKDVFAFAVLPVIFYFSFFIQILYYLGVMQSIILNLGSILQRLMGTSICESIICAANTFIGMTESPLLIKPYLNRMTISELHTIMCSGFATVSGTVLAAYIGFGADPAHLITASLMAAPATLCYAKLFYPETEESLVSSDNIKLEKSKDSGLMDAASKGALAGIPLVLGIIANIIAFVSFIALVNSILLWLGLLVGFDQLSFEYILSKVFMPLSWIMGVPWKHCEDVATLIGLKTVVNEFIAYQKLGEFKRAGRIYGRSEAIATFAICGFANPGSVGITLGVLSSLAPERKEQVTNAVIRAFVAGSAVCFLTASIAGLLMTDESYNYSTNSTILNTTVAGTVALSSQRLNVL